MSKKLDIATESGSKVALIDENLLKSKVYTIRGVKVMLDADLAEIYGYSTKDFNRQVKNNIARFPSEFRFPLTVEEVEILRCKNCTSSWGGRRYEIMAFTEQGIYMLMTVLKGDLAVRQSIALVRLFKEMKDYIAAENQQLLGCANCAQIATLTAKHSQEMAEIRSDVTALKIESRQTQDSLGKVMEFFHDRYVVLDFETEGERIFHCGASSKDAGGKITTIMEVECPEVYHSVIRSLL